MLGKLRRIRDAKKGGGPPFTHESSSWRRIPRHDLNTMDSARRPRRGRPTNRPRFAKHLFVGGASWLRAALRRGKPAPQTPPKPKREKSLRGTSTRILGGANKEIRKAGKERLRSSFPDFLIHPAAKPGLISRCGRRPHLRDSVSCYRFHGNAPGEALYFCGTVSVSR